MMNLIIQNQNRWKWFCPNLGNIYSMIFRLLLQILLIQQRWLMLSKCTSCKSLPYHLLGEAEVMIRDLTAGVLRECSTPTKCCASSNFIRKPSGHCLCFVSDFRPSNAYRERVRWPFWSASELQHNILPDSKIFWSLDYLSGYYQIPLAEESQPLTPFLTMFGKFCYHHLPQGFDDLGDSFFS